MKTQPEEALLKAVTKAFSPDGEPTAFDAIMWGEIHGAITWMLEENRRVRAANIDCVNHFDALMAERKPLTDEQWQVIADTLDCLITRKQKDAIEAVIGIKE